MSGLWGNKERSGMSLGSVEVASHGSRCAPVSCGGSTVFGGNLSEFITSESVVERLGAARRDYKTSSVTVGSETTAAE